MKPSAEATGRTSTAVALWAIFACMLLIAGLLLSRPSSQASPELHQALGRLAAEMDRLRAEQGMPAVVLERHRASICFIYGIYSLRGGGSVDRGPHRVSGSGFVVADGLIATNRHIAEPWFEDPAAEALLKMGASARLEKLVAFFPGAAQPVTLHDARVSRDADLAVLRFDPAQLPRRPVPLPLAETPGPPGTAVIVVGYPMGITAMLAKSPHPLDRRLSRRADDIGTANELASLLLIRPSATHGHLGDVVGDKLLYDAPTAPGASGGPVFNSRGEVIGVNSAFLEGFSGGTLGVSVEALRALLQPPTP